MGYSQKRLKLRLYLSIPCNSTQSSLGGHLCALAQLPLERTLVVNE
jgi:hypothetical protein